MSAQLPALTLEELTSELGSRTRALAAVGAGFGTSISAAKVLEAALMDADPMVAAAALSAIHFPTDDFKDAMPALKKKAARRLDKTADRDIDLNTRTLLAP